MIKNVVHRDQSYEKAGNGADFVRWRAKSTFEIGAGQLLHLRKPVRALRRRPRTSLSLDLGVHRQGRRRRPTHRGRDLRCEVQASVHVPYGDV